MYFCKDLNNNSMKITNLSRTIGVIIALVLCLSLSAQTNKWRDIHKVKKGETIFGIAREYGINVQQLLDANPEMKAEGYELKKGEWVFVPFAKEGDENTDALLKKMGAQNAQPTQNAKLTQNAQAAQKPATTQNDVIRLGVMLPLHNNDGDGRRMIEYYRGVLLALNQLKAEGINTEVHAWNVPIDADINTTLVKDEARNLNLVIGPLYSNMVKPMAEYVKKNNAKMVIPFSISDDAVTLNSQIFQIYQSPEELNQKAITAFLERFPNGHPIFINCNDNTSDKGVFTAGLRRELDGKGRAYNLTNVNTPIESFAKAFNPSKTNVIVLNTAKSPQLNQVFAKLDSLKQTHRDLAIAMYGYTEWLMYQKYDTPQFHRYSVYIPTTFYYNANAERTKQLEKLYQDTYGVAMDPAGLPRFAITGYDQAMYFIRGLKKYGAQFTGAENQSEWKSLQSRFVFSRVGQGGYKNRNFQLIHFKSDQTMEAITY